MITKKRDGRANNGGARPGAGRPRLRHTADCTCAKCMGEMRGRRRKDNPIPVEKRRRIKESQWKRTYGITGEDYDRMFEAQNGRCAICWKEEARLFQGTPRHLSVDHCHKTNIVRGLLCFACNTGLGHFADDVILLRRAIQYLQSSEYISSSVNLREDLRT
jgi:hypothetical protein